jgi:excinuclease ABC subunit A
VRVDGDVHPIDEVPKLTKTKKHTIEVVVDRLVQKEDMRRRLADSIETALQLADGVAMIEVVPTREAVEEARAAGAPEPQTEVLTFSEHLACAHCGLSFEQLAPRNFSFNSPYGACETCSGLGTQLTVDPEMVLGDPQLSVVEGVVLPWGIGAQSNYYQQLLRATVEHVGDDPTTPWADLSDAAREAVLHGLPDRVHVSYTNRYGRKRSYKARIEGVLPSLLRRHAETDSEHVRQQVEQYMREVPCPACDGKRLKPVVLGVTVGGRSIADLTGLSVADAEAFVANLDLTEREALIGLLEVFPTAASNMARAWDPDHQSIRARANQGELLKDIGGLLCDTLEGHGVPRPDQACNELQRLLAGALG